MLVVHEHENEETSIFDFVEAWNYYVEEFPSGQHFRTTWLHEREAHEEE